MGRLINIEWFSTDEAYQQEREDVNTIRRLSAKAQNEPDDLHQARFQISKRIKDRFKGKIICRSPGTIGRDGLPLVKLPGKRRITVEIEPTEREKAIFSYNANAEKEEYVTHPPMQLALTLCD